MASDLFVHCLKVIFLQILLTSSLFLLHRRGLQTHGLPGSARKRQTGQPIGGSTTLSSSHIFDRAAQRESSLLFKPVPVAGTTLLCGVSPDSPWLVILATKSCVRGGTVEITNKQLEDMLCSWLARPYRPLPFRGCFWTVEEPPRRTERGQQPSLPQS